MESLKKIRSNRPFLKEIRQSDEYPKYMKELVTNKPLTMENEDVRMNHRYSALLFNQLPSKEKDPGSFILPCSIGRLDFNNALADLGASISIMPFSMYKRLGIGKLDAIKMNIELADNSKCILKGIVRNLLIKIDKFILPIDFIVLDVLEDFRMPVILGRPLLATAHAKVDVLKKSISLEVGNEKVVFKMKSDLPDMRNESVLMIKSNMIAEEDELMNIESDLFTYITNTCESCHILAVDTDLFTYEVVTQETYSEIAHKCCLTAQETIRENTKPILGKRKPHWCAPIYRQNNGIQEVWASCNPSNKECDGGSLRNNEIRCYWESENDNDHINIEWNDLRTPDDEDDIEGIIDYLEPTSYDGFIDLDEEEYNKWQCRLLGMSYIKPLPIIIEQVKITRYSLGPGEVYTKLEVSNMEELPRTRNNVATIRSNIMDEFFENYENENSEARSELGDKERTLYKSSGGMGVELILDVGDLALSTIFLPVARPLVVGSDSQLAWERFNDMLYNCPEHKINEHEQLQIFYQGLDPGTRKKADFKGPIPRMTPAARIKAIDELSKHSLSWYKEEEYKKNDFDRVLKHINDFGHNISVLNEEVRMVQHQYKTPNDERDSLLEETISSFIKEAHWMQKKSQNFVWRIKRNYDRTFKKLGFAI
ncbi:hypothetical protein Tco_0144618 [Tanacetum coccineum]